MAYKKYRKRKQEDSIDLFDLLKRLIQWAHYQGGIPLVFIVIGALLITIFAILSYWLGYNWVVLGLGIASIFLGGICYFVAKK